MEARLCEGFAADERKLRDDDDPTRADRQPTEATVFLQGLHRLHARGNDAVRSSMSNGRTHGKACQYNESSSSKLVLGMC